MVMEMGCRWVENAVLVGGMGAGGSIWGVLVGVKTCARGLIWGAGECRWHDMRCWWVEMGAGGLIQGAEGRKWVVVA